MSKEIFTILGSKIVLIYSDIYSKQVWYVKLVELETLQVIVKIHCLTLTEKKY